MFQLVENALMGMIFIDERVYEYYTRSEDEIKQRWNFANIVSLDDKKIGSAEKLKSEIESTTKESPQKFSFLIIHQGVLDKIINENNELSFISSTKTLLDQLRTLIPYIIITSGRGKPDKIAGNEKFIPFSTISETILKPYHEKFLLTSILLKLTIKSSNG